ncbi:MAG: HEPN domain-containing protein [Synechococcus sp. SB0665_bin_28]|nr:HEPN domain-containing protein [Synechococcus sp. SB0665_bin_28]MYF20154.1 HEPN domain-containing protein [Synechococcus sp. SB0677_bin_5]
MLTRVCPMSKPEATTLLRIARRDLVAASFLHEPHASEASWGLLIHQALEKVLKAWLVTLGVPVPPVYDLQILIHLLYQHHVNITELSQFMVFNQFAAQCRHESDPDPLYLNRHSWEMRAEELVNHLSAMVKS